MPTEQSGRDLTNDHRTRCGPAARCTIKRFTHAYQASCGPKPLRFFPRTYTTLAQVRPPTLVMTRVRIQCLMSLTHRFIASPYITLRFYFSYSDGPRGAGAEAAHRKLHSLCHHTCWPEELVVCSAHAVKQISNCLLVQLFLIAFFSFCYHLYNPQRRADSSVI